jgi:hypothetical protein
MFWLPILCLGVIVLVLEFLFNRNWIRAAIVIIAAFALSGITFIADINSQITDTEIWSGTVVEWEHVEEWDEWHPPSESCSTDSNGKRSCTTTPGYYEHHNATNSIKTSDEGWISVEQAPEGKSFNDEWPNDDTILKKHWPKGTPTASNHKYINKVNASYSIYKHEEINIEDYPDLPPYPDKVRDKFFLDRIYGNVPNKDKANELLSMHNSRLNEMIPDTEKPGKQRSWKQVNIIFVNVGPNKTEDYGFALQDSWEGGNKNDFVVSFSMNDDGTLNWVYPFSWSEVELLKLEVRDYMMDLKKIDDFTLVIDEVAKKVEDKFERKQFADFDYLQVSISSGALTFIWFLNLFGLIVNIVLTVVEKRNSNLYGRRVRRNKFSRF